MSPISTTVLVEVVRLSLTVLVVIKKNFLMSRCDSDNTKFCYYNTYNKTQPRYFC
ncbi:putative transcription factor C2C2-Dof family [Arabidopsis thaliana]